MKNAVLMLLALELAIPRAVSAQVPTGAISGVVADATGAAIPSASVVIADKDTGLKRMLFTSDTGGYSASALLPGS